MTENLKKFLEAVSKDEAMKAELDAFMKGNAQKDGKAFLDFAASKGFTLTDDDFKPEAGELSNDELKAVAGGEECGQFSVFWGNCSVTAHKELCGITQMKEFLKI